MYPQRRVFFVQIWMTEVTSDDEDDNEERIVYCSSPAGSHCSDVVSLKEADLNNDENNNSFKSSNDDCYDGDSEGYETLDNDELNIFVSIFYLSLSHIRLLFFLLSN